MASSGFYEMFDKEGYLTKTRARFGKCKEVTLNSYNGVTYLHLADNSKCFSKDGTFDYTKSKSVSLKWDEVELFTSMVTSLRAYKDRLNYDRRNVRSVPDICLQNSSTLPPPPPPPPYAEADSSQIFPVQLTPPPQYPFQQSLPPYPILNIAQPLPSPTLKRAITPPTLDGTAYEQITPHTKMRNYQPLADDYYSFY